MVALSFAVSPVVSQNFGRRRADRVRHSVYSAMGIASLMMLVLTLIAFFAPGTLIRTFSRDPRVIAFGSEYLRIVSVNFVSAGIVFVTSSVFQGIGNTLPPLFSSMTRLVLFAMPAIYISRLISCCCGTNYESDFDSTNRTLSFLRVRRRRSRARQALFNLINQLRDIDWLGERSMPFDAETSLCLRFRD